jgi:hypothetical protein
VRIYKYLIYITYAEKIFCYFGMLLRMREM